MVKHVARTDGELAHIYMKMTTLVESAKPTADVTRIEARIAELEDALSRGSSVEDDYGGSYGAQRRRLDHLVDKAEFRKFTGVGYRAWVEDFADRVNSRFPQLAQA